MRNLERRVAAIESNGPPRGEWAARLDEMSDGELDRLERLIASRDAGEWADVAALDDDDLRLIASIRIGEPVPCDT